MTEKCELISEELEKQLVELFEKIEKKVILKCVFDSEQKESFEMKKMVMHIANMTEKIEMYEVEKDSISNLETEHLPLTIIFEEDKNTGISFHGVPGGQEINSFLSAILLAGGAKKSKVDVEDIYNKHSIAILVSLACHHCAKQVINCQEIAFLSENVSAAMYDARLYPDIIEKYKIERIPMTIIDEKDIFMGVKEIDELKELLS